MWEKNLISFNIDPHFNIKELSGHVLWLRECVSIFSPYFDADVRRKAKAHNACLDETKKDMRDVCEKHMSEPPNSVKIEKLKIVQ